MRENVIILSFADENIIIKVTCTNSQDMIALKTGHQNAFSVIHSMRLPVGKAWIVNMFESCGTPLFEGDGSAHRNQSACRRMLAPSLAITSLASSLSRTQKMKEGEGGQNR